MADKGNISEKPVTEIFRNVFAAKATGLLRLSLDKQIKVVLLEEGRPVYALSNVPDDQLDVHLVRQRLLTPQQAKEVKAQVQREQELPAKILELEMLDAAQLQEARLDQIARIVQSVLLWREGEYVLDTAARAAHDITLDAPLEQWLLDASHSVSASTAREILDAAGGVFAPNEAARTDLQLSPLDGFLVSRLTEPMTIDEIAALSGLPEDQYLPALYALYASGLIASTTEPPPSQPVVKPPVETGPSIEEVRVELEQTLGFYRTANLYEVLGVTNAAEAAEIKRAYYALAKKYHPDRYHAASDREVREKLEAVFAFVSRAYETLFDARQRADYDRRLGANASVAAASPSPNPAPTTAAPPVSATATATPPSAPYTPPPPVSTPPPAEPEHAPPVYQSQSAPDGDLGGAPPAGLDTEQLAEHHFREGMRRLNSRDLVGAVQLLRQAVQLVPTNGQYQLQLGMTLSQNQRWLKEAERHLLEAQRYEPLNVQIFLKLGEIYTTTGLKKRAESQYRAVLNIDPFNRVAQKGLSDLGVEVPSMTGRKAPKTEEKGGFFSKLFKRGKS